MDKNNNQKLVKEFLNTSPLGVSLNQIKSLFGDRKNINIKKVIEPMLNRNEIIFDSRSGLYSINYSYVMNHKTGMGYAVPKNKRGPRAVLYYPELIPYFKMFDDFCRHNNLQRVDNLVLLNVHNSKIVEALIKNDSRYKPLAKELYFKFCRDKENSKSFVFNKENVASVIEQIDKDNSTFDVAISRKIHKTTATSSFCTYIVNPQNNFLGRLNSEIPTEINKGLSELVDSLKDAHVYYNAKSLASKVCKYFHEYYYYNDKYYINDKVVRSMLPYYLDYYGITHNLLKAKDRNLKYVDLYDFLEMLREAAYKKHGEYIKRSELDHIIWYCYKIYKNKEE